MDHMDYSYCSDRCKQRHARRGRFCFYGTSGFALPNRFDHHFDRYISSSGTRNAGHSANEQYCGAHDASVVPAYDFQYATSSGCLSFCHTDNR
ncbi:hypothetical protein D3C74_428820 [compost metagenome]